MEWQRGWSNDFDPSMRSRLSRLFSLDQIVVSPVTGLWRVTLAGSCGRLIKKDHDNLLSVPGYTRSPDATFAFWLEWNRW